MVSLVSWVLAKPSVEKISMLPSELNAVVGLAIRQALEYEFQLLTTYIPVFHLLRFWFICMFYLLLEG